MKKRKFFLAHAYCFFMQGMLLSIFPSDLAYSSNFLWNQSNLNIWSLVFSRQHFPIAETEKGNPLNYTPLSRPLLKGVFNGQKTFERS